MLQYLVTMMETREDEGQGLVEYALILAFVAVACVIAITALGDRVVALFDSITF